MKRLDPFSAKGLMRGEGVKNAYNELKIDFPGFQTMGMNLATSEFEYHEDLNLKIQIPAKIQRNEKCSDWAEI